MKATGITNRIETAVHHEPPSLVDATVTGGPGVDQGERRAIHATSNAIEIQVSPDGARGCLDEMPQPLDHGHREVTAGGVEPIGIDQSLEG